MSGALGGISSLISRGGQAISGAQSIASGIGGLLGFGSTGPVALGPFVFADFEIPALIQWGGQQQHTVHKLPGGGRVVDAMGRDDRPVAWSGIFLGSGAETRAIQLDGMKNAGKPLTLTWGAHNLQVLIASVECETRQIGAHVTYQISCTVLSINQKPMALGGPTSLLGAIPSDIGQAAAVVQNGISQVTKVVGGVAQIASAAGIRVPFLNQLSSGLAQASGAVGAVSSLAAAAPAVVQGGINLVQGMSAYGDAASTTLMNDFNSVTSGSAAMTPTAAVQAVTIGSDAVSTQAESTAAASYSGQAAATAASAASSGGTFTSFNQSGFFGGLGSVISGDGYTSAQQAVIAQGIATPAQTAQLSSDRAALYAGIGQSVPN
ncbi:MAG: hypothetical protein ACRYG8_24225 [Janthinobacterium lividum]